MKASSESGECASFISTVSFSVFEAACWPDMGLLVSFQVRTRSAWLRPALILPRDYPAHERVCRRRTGENVRVTGASEAPSRRQFASESLTYWRAANNWQDRGLKGNGRGSEDAESPVLQRRDHASDGVVEGGSAVKVRLPESLKQLQVVAPAALVEALPERVRRVAAAGDATVVVAASCSRTKHGAEDFTGGVEDQRVPQVAGNGFIALAAFADNGGLHRLGDAVRGLVEEHLESLRALIARVQAGNSDAQGVDRGVGTSPIGVAGDVDADFLARPARLVNVRKPFRQAHALFAHQRSDASDPPAVGAIVLRPEMLAIDRRDGFKHLRQLCWQAGVAEFALPAGEFVAILEIPELIFQLAEVAGEEQVFTGVIRRVVGDGLIPNALFRRSESGFRIRRDLQGWPGVLAVLVRRGGRLLPGVVIERVMKIDPKAAMKFKNRKWTVGGIVLRPGCCQPPGREHRNRNEKKEGSHCWFARHSESHDSSPKSPPRTNPRRRQIRLPL